MKNKKGFIISSVIVLFVSLICIGIKVCAVDNVKTNVELSDTGYKSITINYVHKKSVSEIFNDVAKAEQDILEFFNNSTDKENNTRLFEIYMDNLNSYREDFFKSHDYSKPIGDYGIKVYPQISDANTEPSRILSPKVNVFYFEYRGALGLGLNNDYIIKTYGPHINDEWVLYFKYEKQLDAELARAHYLDDGSIIDVYRKWADKWAKFVGDYPDFYMNSQIKQTVYDYRNIVSNY